MTDVKVINKFDEPVPVMNFGSLVPTTYNGIELTYVTSGNGIGQIYQVIYKVDGSPVATLTLTYDGNDKLSEVTKS